MTDAAYKIRGRILSAVPLFFFFLSIFIFLSLIHIKNLLGGDLEGSMGVRLVGGLEPGLAWQVTAGKHPVVQYLENTPVVFSLFIQVVHTDHPEGEVKEFSVF